MKNISLVKKLLIGFGTLAVLSLIIVFTVNNASAKAEVKAKEAAQIQQQLVKDTADAALKVKQAERDKVVADAKLIADFKAKVDADLIAVREEDARMAKINEDNAVQVAIAKQKKVTLSAPTLSTPAPNVPTLSVPTLNAPTPVASGVMESSIDGTFNGWTGDTIFKLRNGQIWQQSSYAYTYHYAYSPAVTIYQSGVTYKMKVDGVDSTISVTRLK